LKAFEREEETSSSSSIIQGSTHNNSEGMGMGFEQEGPNLEDSVIA